MIDIAIGWIAFILYYASPALVFGLTAMAWQRFPYRPFFLLALSSMLTLLVAATDGILTQHELNDDAYVVWTRCRNVVVIIDGILYPWSLWLIFRFIQENRVTLTNPREQSLP